LLNLNLETFMPWFRVPLLEKNNQPVVVWLVLSTHITTWKGQSVLSTLQPLAVQFRWLKINGAQMLERNG
jgi:hypothetical protein